MSFLFGRSKAKEAKEIKDTQNINDLLDNNFIEISSHQPENVYKDILILPPFSSFIANICILDSTRAIFGDYNGNLSVWDIEYGRLLAKLKLHTESINGIILLNHSVHDSAVNENLKQNDTTIQTIVALSSDKTISSWDESSYKLLNSVSCGSNAHRLLLNVNNELFLTAGVDIKLFDSNLNLMHEYNRSNKENSIKLMIPLKNDRIVTASNFDIEIYSIVNSSSVQKSPVHGKSLERSDSQVSDNGFKLRELKRFLNAHRDSILTLENISDTAFASGSSDGHLVLWLSVTLIKSIELRPFNELNKNEIILRLNLTSINAICTFDQRYLVISSGNHLCIYDNILKDYCCKVINAHSSKITDVIVINSQIVTSGDDGSIRIWKIGELNHAQQAENNEKFSLILIGECLGHSASIKSLSTITKNEIISIGYDNMVIVWRNSYLMESNRNLTLAKLFSKVSV